MPTKFSITNERGEHTVIGFGWTRADSTPRFAWASGSYSHVFHAIPHWIYKDEDEKLTLRDFLDYLKDRDGEEG